MQMLRGTAVHQRCHRVSGQSLAISFGILDARPPVNARTWQFLPGQSARDDQYLVIWLFG
jgi:hypothetical protein